MGREIRYFHFVSNDILTDPRRLASARLTSAIAFGVSLNLC